jgi:hypothetical protein
LETVLQGNEAQVEAQIGARFVPNVPQPQKSFWTHPMEVHGDVGNVVSCFGPFGDSVGVGAR